MALMNETKSEGSVRGDHEMTQIDLSVQYVAAIGRLSFFELRGDRSPFSPHRGGGMFSCGLSFQ
jgi:hypothetical protein